MDDHDIAACRSDCATAGFLLLLRQQKLVVDVLFDLKEIQIYIILLQ